MSEIITFGFKEDLRAIQCYIKYFEMTFELVFAISKLNIAYKLGLSVSRILEA